MLKIIHNIVRSIDYLIKIWTKHLFRCFSLYLMYFHNSFIDKAYLTYYNLITHKSAFTFFVWKKCVKFIANMRILIVFSSLLLYNRPDEVSSVCQHCNLPFEQLYAKQILSFFSYQNFKVLLGYHQYFYFFKKRKKYYIRSSKLHGD